VREEGGREPSSYSIGSQLTITNEFAGNVRECVDHRIGIPAHPAPPSRQQQAETEARFQVYYRDLSGMLPAVTHCLLESEFYHRNSVNAYARIIIQPHTAALVLDSNYSMAIRLFTRFTPFTSLTYLVARSFSAVFEVVLEHI